MNFFFGSKLHCYYHRRLCHSLVRSVILLRLFKDHLKKKLRGGHANLRQIVWRKGGFFLLVENSVWGGYFIVTELNHGQRTC